MEKLSKKIKLNRIQTLTMYFFIFAFLGWVMETLYSIYTLGHFTKRGFLYGPICPIYGFGALMLILFLAKYRNNNLKLFIYAAIIFSAFEYVVSYGLDALFAMHWWDYTNEFFNLNGRISIFYSGAWGINLLLAKIPYTVQVSTLYLLCGIWIVDTIASFIRYL